MPTFPIYTLAAIYFISRLSKGYRIALWLLKKNIEDGSIIITSEGICQNLDVYDKWKLIDISILLRADTLHDERPMKSIRNEYASKVYSSLSGDEHNDQLIKDLSQWSGGKIYMRRNS